MTFDLKDVAGLSKPVQKMIGVISNGIGTLYRPMAMRKEADARAYEIRTLAAARADAEVINANGDTRAYLERVNNLAAINPELIDRAKQRLLSREIEGQLNVEQISEHALSQLPTEVSEQPVADDWRRKFFQEAENICDKDLQQLWGKVLAGEVVSPGSYSYRTLEVLKQLSQPEAELFRQLCSLAFSGGWVFRPPGDINIALAPYGLNYSGLLMLRDAGLMHQSDNLEKQFGDPRTGVHTVLFFNNGLYMQVSGPALSKLKLPAFALTLAGQQLQNLIEPNPVLPYLQTVADYFRRNQLSVKRGTKIEDSDGKSIMSFDDDF